MPVEEAVDPGPSGTTLDPPIHFWRVWLAGKIGILCLRFGFSDLGGRLINYELSQTLRIVWNEMQRREKAGTLCIR